MALRSLNGDVSELCLGKPELTWIAATATVSDAVTALKTSGETYLSVWLCRGDRIHGSCVCVGKFCMADVILFLCRPENLGDPFKALEVPVCEILPKGLPIVRHLEPNYSLLEAIDCILEGTQNLVIPIQNHWCNNSRKRFLNNRHKGHECCWLTPEDVVRFLLNSVGAFSPVPTFNIKSLDVIDRDIMTVTYNEPASSALAFFHRAITEQKSVAVVDEENRLIGEISPSTLACCDKTVAPAIMALSAMDLMTCIDCGGSPQENLVQLVKTRLEERKLGGMVDVIDELFQSLSSSSFSSSSSCSSDDEFGSWKSGWSGRSRGSSRPSAANCEAITCSPGSSLLAVMIQALTHRVSCVWVVEEDRTVVGNVTLVGILNVFRSVACEMNSK